MITSARLLAALLGTLALSVLASTAAAATSPPAPAKLSMTLEHPAAEVSFTLSWSDCRNALFFGPEFAGERAKRMPLAPGFHWTGDQVERDDGACFRSVSWRISPDDHKLDRRYVLLGHAGGATLVFLPYLLPDFGRPAPLDVDIRWSTAACAGRAACHQTLVVPPDQQNRNLIVDPAGLRHHGATHPLVDERVPAEVLAWFGREWPQIVGFYEQHLGAIPANDVDVVLTRLPNASRHASWGSVSGNQVVFLLEGPGWDAVPDIELAQLRRMFAHEAAHLWNAWQHPFVRDMPVWVYEGMAEYAAVRYERGHGDIAADDMGALLGLFVNRCVAALGNGPAALQNGGGPYSCGTSVEWLWDVDLHRHDSGQDMFTLWRHVWQRAAGRRVERSDLDAELERLTGSADTSSADWIEHPSPEVSEALAARLDAMGVRYRLAAPDPSRELAAAMSHLSRQVCASGHFGYAGDDDGLTLTNPDDCGVLSGSPQITRIAGLRVGEHPERGVLAAVTVACAKGEAVPFTTATGTIVDVPCATSNVAQVPRTVQLTDAYPGWVEMGGTPKDADAAK